MGNTHLTKLSKNDVATLRLFRTPQIGPITFHKLLDRYKTAENAIDALPEFTRNRQKQIKAIDLSIIEDEIAHVQNFGGDFVFYNDDRYPALLKQIVDAPPVLTYKGQIDVLNQNIFGIVGARNASLSGLQMAKKISADIGQAGYITASGLARGIDTIVHENSLNTGTIAVIAGGIDVIYPQENTDLYHNIQEQGCILAESPFGCEPQARHFPKRNRIISGIAKGVLVVEAALKSGSLITAQQAADQGRDVFAVPGSPMDPRASGANKLLQDGAHLTTSSKDIIEILGRQIIPPRPMPKCDNDLFAASENDPIMPEKQVISQKVKTVGDNIGKELLSLLSHVPVDIDQLIRQSGHATPKVQTALLELELSGLIERHPGNKVNLI